MKLTDFFKQAKEGKRIFRNKDVLTDRYFPDKIMHRDEQIKAIAEILSPALRLERPSNLFIYGKPGTGKTLVIKYVTKEMEKVAKEDNVPLDIIYVNCKMKKVADTEYRLLAHLIRCFGKRAPLLGIPTYELYRNLFSILDEKERLAILIFDEIDELVKKTGDNILYNFTRINENLERAKVSIVGISNDIVFVENLDPRVKSSLGEEEVIFPPYDANQLRDILWQRAKLAFEPEAISDAVISKCAAYAAREHGDARKALDLLRVAGEIAEREGRSKVLEQDVDKALEKLERDRIIEIVKVQPIQSKLILLAIINAIEKKGEPIEVGDVYDEYERITEKFKIRPISQRRASDLISEWDMFGVINARTVSFGKYGRKKEIKLAIPNSIKTKIIEVIENSI